MKDNRYVNDKVSTRDADEDAIYRDAWRIADPGASNPVAVAGTLAQASSALLHHIGTDGVRKHPALRLMAAQLASLYNVNSDGGGGLGGDDNDFIEEVRRYVDCADAERIGHHVADFPKIPHESKIRHLREHDVTDDMTRMSTYTIHKKHKELHAEGNHGA